MKEHKNLVLLTLSAVAPFSCFVFYLVAYYPGMMTVDSIDQWTQIVTLEFDDWHPVIHTLFNYLCTRIWYSPASVALGQIVIMVLVFTSGIYTLYKVGIRRRILAVITVLFAIYPANGFMVVTLWKDVLYSIMILWMTILLIHITCTNGEWIHSTRNQVLFAINALGVLFFRHNGILTFLFVIVTLLVVFFRQYKRWLALAAIILAINFIVTGPVFQILKVKEAPSTEAMGIPMQQIAAVVKYNGQLTQEQSAFISKILPMEVWRDQYHPYVSNPLKFDEHFNAEFLMEHKAEFVKHWLAIVGQNPRITATAYLKHTSLIWRIEPYEDSFTYTITPGIIENNFGLQAVTLSTGAKELGAKIFEFTNGERMFLFIWRPALWLYISLLSGILIAIRTNWKVLLVLGPMVSNTAAFFIAIPAQDYRYQYANVLVATLLLPWLVQALYKRKELKCQ